MDLRTWTEEQEPRLVIVAVVDDRVRAAVCAALLEQHGIGARVAESGKQIPDSYHDWVCPQCVAEIEAGFDLCWNCQTMRPGLEEATD